LLYANVMTTNAAQSTAMMATVLRSMGGAVRSCRVVMASAVAPFVPTPPPRPNADRAATTRNALLGARNALRAPTTNDDADFCVYGAVQVIVTGPSESSTGAV
jgi:hypothetical protein